MSDNIDLLKQIVSSVQKKNDKEQVNDTIRTKPAKVIGVDEETYKVFVYFLEDTEQKEYTFYNKSGEILSEGDTVKVFYTTNVAKGWIGARNGEPSIKEYIGVGRPSEWDKTSEYFNCYSGYGQNIAGLKGSSGKYATARGFRTKATGYYSSSEGCNTEANGDSSHAEGSNNRANGWVSHVEGNSNTVSGCYASHAEGQSNLVTSDYGHAEGESNTVSGTAAHAEGGGNTVSGFRSHAEGNDNTASGIYSHAEGEKNTASDYASHAEGLQSQATGRCSHAEGDGTTASGDRCHAEGSGTQAIGTVCHAEGLNTIAANYASHAEGEHTESKGKASHAGGGHTIVEADYSFGFGYGILIPKNNSPYNSRVYVGKYNDYSSWNIIFAIGNGDDDSNRSNAFAVDHDGNVYCKSINGIPINSENSYTYTPYSTSEAVESAKTIFEAVMGG